MKKVKLLSVFIFIFLFCCISFTQVRADIGPKPSVTITIDGMEGISYTAAMVGTYVPGPYQGRVNNPDPHLPIMDYHDDEGFKYIGMYWEEKGNATLTWSYYPPGVFKVVIMTDSGTTYVTKQLSRYAFNTYYKISLASQTDDGSEQAILLINVQKDYNYSNEIFSFIIRVILTIIIELLIALLFGFRKKRELLIILIVNAITQLFLNLVLNLGNYYSGSMIAGFLYTLSEGGVFLIELLAYSLLLQKRGFLRIFFYTISANLLSFLTGLILYGMLFKLYVLR